MESSFGSVPVHWRLRKERYALVGEICENGHFEFPPRDRCLVCTRDFLEPVDEIAVEVDGNIEEVNKVTEEMVEEPYFV